MHVCASEVVMPTCLVLICQQLVLPWGAWQRLVMRASATAAAGNHSAEFNGRSLVLQETLDGWRDGEYTSVSTSLATTAAYALAYQQRFSRAILKAV